MIIRRSLLPLTLVIVAVHAAQTGAQEAFPAPLSGQAPSNTSPSQPANGLGTGSFPTGGAAPITGSAFERPASPSLDQCTKSLTPLREEAETRGQLIKAASARHAPPDEACKLISNYGQAEMKMIKYVEAHSADCGIPPQIADQLKTGHKNTEALQRKVCAVARRAQGRDPAGPVGDFDDIR